MPLERFCRKSLVTVGRMDTVSHAARLMREKHVGAVIVTDANARPLGILTDRDITCRVVAEAMDPISVRVDNVMTPNPVLIRNDESIDSAVVKMRKGGVRRLPVVDPEGKLVGVTTIDDLNVLLAAELAETAKVVRADRGP